MNKDSLEMTDADHDLIVSAASKQAATHDGIVIVHGTDRLAKSGHCLVEELGVPRVPIVLTGAMRPWEMRSTDAVQNLTEALLAVQLVKPGVYVAMHNQVLQFPGVEKDSTAAGGGTFIKRG
jgi:L-asparaginase